MPDFTNVLIRNRIFAFKNIHHELTNDYELKCVLMTRIINVAGIRDIQFQFR